MNDDDIKYLCGKNPCHNNYSIQGIFPQRYSMYITVYYHCDGSARYDSCVTALLEYLGMGPINTMFVIGSRFSVALWVNNGYALEY